MSDKEQPTLADGWLARLKNRPTVAVIIVLGVIVVGIASFTEAVSKLIDALGLGPPKPQPQIIVTVPPTAASSGRRVYFRTEFTLKDDEESIDHGVTVRVGNFFSKVPEGQIKPPATANWAPFGASADGAVEVMDRVWSDSEIRLTRKDCDSLVVLVKSVQVSPVDPGVTLEQIMREDPGLKKFAVSRQVTGEILGRCEE